MSKPNEDRPQKEVPHQTPPPQQPQTPDGILITTKPNGIVITNYVGEAD